MRLAISLVLFAVSTAHAEPDGEDLEVLDTTAVHLRVQSAQQAAASALLDAPDGPALRLSPIAHPNGVAFGAKERAVRQAWAIGTHLVLSTENVAWKSAPDLDITSRGWRAIGTLSIDLGTGLRLGLTYGKGNVYSRYGAGTYSDRAIAITRSKKLSRWMTGWIALAVAHRTWDGIPPLGEANSTQGMVTVGTTFR